MVGIVIATPAGAEGVFWAFTAVGLVAATLVALVPRSGLTDRPRPVVGDGQADRQVPA